MKARLTIHLCLVLNLGALMASSILLAQGADSVQLRILPLDDSISQSGRLELTIRGSEGPVTIESSTDLRTWVEHSQMTLQGDETKLREPLEGDTKFYRLVPQEREPEPTVILSFDANVLLETTSQTSANVSIGDVNHDGHQDIVLAKGRHWPLMNRVLIGDGKGGFPSVSNLGDEADRSYFGKLHDMDGDGDLDVVVSNDQPDSNKVYLNDGAGSFEISSLFGETAWKTRNASIADMNGDDLPDIIVANRSGSTGGSNYICLNQGDGNFEGECIAFSHYSATTITPADFNNDGVMDLAVPHRDGGQSHVFIQTGNDPLAFRKVPFGPSNASVRASQAADFNGDGRVDIVTIDTSRRELRVYHQEADETYTAGIRLGGTSSTPYALLVDDLNGDQRADIILGHRLARPIVYFNDGGDSSEGFIAVPFGDARGAAYGFSTGDLNEDGVVDIAMARSDAPNVLYLGALPEIPEPEPEPGIWLMQSDGVFVRPLALSEGTNEEPDFSPDGRKVVFDSDRDGARNLYVVDLETGELTQLTDSPAKEDHGAWSPDGEWIVYQYELGGNTDVWKIRADGTEKQRLTSHSARDGWPDWSPDGNTIAFASQRTGARQIYLMDPDGSNVRKLTLSGSNDDPAWSPNGEQIAFSSTRDGNSEIYLMQADGSEQRNLTQTPQLNEDKTTWSAGGLVFTQRSSTARYAATIDPETKAITRLTDQDDNCSRPSMSPDGRWAVVECR